MPGIIAPTTAAVLTPPARGAIATVSVQGPEAIALADRFFKSLGKVGLRDAQIGRILVGHWQGEEEPVGEELVVAKLAEDLVEVHCHGGVQASQRILQHLASAGCQIESWQSRMTSQQEDAIVAEAKLELPRAVTSQAALHLLDQAHGALSREIVAVGNLLDQANFEAAEQKLDPLLSLAPFGKHLTQPWLIVIAGPPNVGKSSLLNKIVGYDRAIVLDMPGTTRDVLHATTALDGWPVQFSDTAGIRISDDEIEQAGIAKAKAALKTADLVIVMHDAADLKPDELDQSLQQLPSALHVVNKIDLASDLRMPDSGEMLATSAVTGQGVPQLISSIVSHLIPCVPQAHQPLPFTARQVEGLRQLHQQVQHRQRDEALQTIQTLLKA
ncbi:tRNA modification GTPase MnmE [Bremerella volcania]|uniref:tRNA modification GTPase MnmE n=1 Tax=Bremerella volcania TaxID=2527984 RepID=A0A518C1Q1_9BACT|nr:GTPase [Bremerella volcania]QDU73151.1 tRNA modification GTPase MnmE [Bremerella volcania]